MTDLTGQTIGRYLILQPIGQGGMATVYKAHDMRLGRDVAIKIIRSDQFGSAVLERILKRFEREGQVLARLDHLHIVKVFEYGEYEGSPYLVMQYIPGGTLKQRLGKPIDYRVAAQLLAPIARALAYAHDRHIVHRDVKPANILITESGEPLLSDFGIAKILEDEEGATLTGTGTGIGTPEYMAPEQGQGQSVDARADIYSLGIVFYELITGRKPFTAETPIATMIKHIHEPLPSPRQFVPGLPGEVEKVLAIALAKKPADRYATMTAFADALEKLGQIKTKAEIAAKPVKKPQSARPRSTPPMSIKKDVTLDAVTIRQPVIRKPVKIPWRKLGMGLGGLAVLGLIAWLFIWKMVPAVGVFLADFQSTRTVINAQRTQNALWTEIAAAWTDSPTITPSLTITPTIAKTATAALTATTTQTIPFTATISPIPPLCTEIGQEWVSPIDHMILVCVPAGTFLMGSTSYQVEQPIHTVDLAAYWIDKTEVTNVQFALCVADEACTTPSRTDSADNTKYYRNPEFDNFPVIYVSWQQAKDYCTWANRQLPTEAMWEKAARGPIGQTYPWGNSTPESSFANYDRNVGDTTRVGSYSEFDSPYGAFDMAGNVWEWVADFYGPYPSEDQSNPTGPIGGNNRTVRGGSWTDKAIFLRATIRQETEPNSNLANVGFRCSITQP